MKAQQLIRWHQAFAQPATYLGIITIITILVGAFFLESEEYERAQQDGNKHAEYFARVLEDNTTSLFHSADSRLLILRKIFHHDPTDLDLVHWLNSSALNKDFAIRFTIVGSDGAIKATSLSPKPDDSFVGDREYFKAHVNSSGDELYVSAPIIDHLAKSATIYLSRRLVASDGSFSGVVLASFDVLELQTLFNSIDIGRGGIISLIGFDGVIRAHSSYAGVSTTEDPNSDSGLISKLLELYHQSPNGTFWSDKTSSRSNDGVHRLISFRGMEEFRMYAVVEVAATEIFSRAQGNVHIGWSKALFFVGAILVAISIAATRERTLIAATSELSYRARHDILTGLENRQAFVDEIDGALSTFRTNGDKFNVLVLDLDRFKDVNDLLGHPAGDALLKMAAHRLNSLLRDTDFLARLGGDEFAIIQRCKKTSGIRNANERVQREFAIALASKIVGCLKQSFEIEGNKLNIGTSIGIALTQDDNVNADELMKRADLALYSAKAEGGSGFVFFDRAMLKEIEVRKRIENELLTAISNNELELHYQEIVDASTRRICGVEALVRWRHPQRGLIDPHEFIPTAEATGLIVPLGKWVLQKACADAAVWPATIKVGVNLSTVQFRKSDLVADIYCALRTSGLPARRLEIDIKETVLSDDNGRNLETLHQLKKLGVTIALDDFGTGHSSLNSLTKFPFDMVKIDRALTTNMTKRPACAAVIATIITLGSCLDISTTAEGIESNQEFESLRSSGIKFAQGYLFGSPRPASEFQFDKLYNSKSRRDDDAVRAAS